MKLSEQVKELEDKLERQKEQTLFFSEQFCKQIEYSQFISKQLSDLHLLVMTNSYYQSSKSMTLWFNPDDVYNIIHRGIGDIK
jgi:hypothetical protein